MRGSRVGGRSAGGEEMATGGGGGSGSSSGSECGALRVSGPGRSYGSTARGPGSPARGPHLEHRLRPGDTLQGLALRYGTEQIKRSNHLYTNDSIFLRPSLRIPAGGTGDSGGETPPVGVAPEGAGEPRPELSPVDFLQHLDARISRCKAAALSKAAPREERMEALPRPRCGPVLGPAPLSRTARSTDLRDAEDLIFDL